jgi:hypothetical protein
LAERDARWGEGFGIAGRIVSGSANLYAVFGAAEAFSVIGITGD